MSRVVNALAPVGQLVRHDIALDQDLHRAVNELLLRADRLVPQALEYTRAGHFVHPLSR